MFSQTFVQKAQSGQSRSVDVCFTIRGPSSYWDLNGFCHAHWFVTWLNGLSTWSLALFICAGFVGITWLGILVIHPHLRRMVHGDEPSNEVIIHSAGTFGLSYAVLPGLLTIATFDSIKNLTGTIDRETSSPASRCFTILPTAIRIPFAAN